jgi:formylglycine-generating enzyme required for sulfatase activity
MPVPIVAGIAAALGLGLADVGKALIVAAPSEAIKRLVNRKMDQIENDASLANAVKEAFLSIGAPEAEIPFQKYVQNLGFDQLQASRNAHLRQEFARAVLLMRSDDPSLVPKSLLDAAGWANIRREVVGEFLANLRFKLSNHPDYSEFIEYADRAEIREHLQAMRIYEARTAAATEQSSAYLRMLLQRDGVDPDKGDPQALKEYVDYVAKACKLISFLFIRPSGRPGQVCTEAELETVFVPLQVQDPETEEKMRQKQSRTRAEDLEKEAERAKPMTVNDVLGKYPVFLLKGLPGSGKTTLLRHLAVSFARGEAAERLGWTGEPLLPILVPLRNFGRFLSDNRNKYTNPAPLALRNFIEDYFKAHELQMQPDFFHRRLNEGHCLVLLDGLDEVANRDLRATVAQMVNAFIKHYGDRGNRFCLASRPKGYEEVADFLPRPVVCTVQPLTPEGRDELVTRLLRVLEPDAPHRPDEPHPLIADIRSKEKVDDLSRNPLFCTTLVLVYKYRGTTLPERRVDVYEELVDLMLGFWETHKAEQGIADAQDLVRLDGTGRDFLDEHEAVEAKRRALTDIADWMQGLGLAEVPLDKVKKRLAQFFHEREGASDAEKGAWAKNFLAVAHQRSGLFVEAQPETYAFSHQNFREYLAATALIEQLDDDMVQTVLKHAGDSWWEEVILLGAAHRRLSDKRREMLLRKMLLAGHVTLAGRCAVDAGARLPAPLRNEIRDALPAVMTNATLDPKERYAAGEALDELGGLPKDIHAWVCCQGCADGGGDLMVMRYPVTNAQYDRFVLARGYDEPRWWGGTKGEGWKWRKKGERRWSSAGTDKPEYWQHPRFGRDRRGYPVVGVSWYEAAAYAAWLGDVLARARKGDQTLPEDDRRLVEGLLAAGASAVRLPEDKEWLNAAGGEGKGKGKDRYPWDPPEGPATIDEEAIKARANTNESGIGGTSPVAMYPLGKSDPFKLMDLAGNVWEWTQSWYDKDKDSFVLRGGSWCSNQDDARCVGRDWDFPHLSNHLIGFRLVSPVVSGF